MAPVQKKRTMSLFPKEGNLLTKEIESWKGFEYALREENRILFNKMLSECRENKDYVRAASSKGVSFSAESLFLALILLQQI
jgi:hypothetical protein